MNPNTHKGLIGLVSGLATFNFTAQIAMHLFTVEWQQPLAQIWSEAWIHISRIGRCLNYSATAFLLLPAVSHESDSYMGNQEHFKQNEIGGHMPKIYFVEKLIVDVLGFFSISQTQEDIKRKGCVKMCYPKDCYL